MIDFPVHAILAEAGENIHADGFGVAAEYTGEPVLKRNDSRIKYTVGAWNCVTLNNRIL
ncbi:hypothetical protein D3C71_1912800 [compost metagenome]